MQWECKVSTVGGGGRDGERTCADSPDSSDSAFFAAFTGVGFFLDLPTLLPITPSESSESSSSCFLPPPRRRPINLPSVHDAPGISGGPARNERGRSENDEGGRSARAPRWRGCPATCFCSPIQCAGGPAARARPAPASVITRERHNASIFPCRNVLSGPSQVSPRKSPKRKRTEWYQRGTVGYEIRWSATVAGTRACLLTIPGVHERRVKVSGAFGWTRHNLHGRIFPAPCDGVYEHRKGSGCCLTAVRQAQANGAAMWRY